MKTFLPNLFNKPKNISKNFILGTLTAAIISIFSFAAQAQTSTETFEDEVANSNTFTDNGVTFSILSKVSVFDIFTGAGLGWSGTANDNKFIDNTGSVSNSNTNVALGIKTRSNLFKVNRFWVYVTNYLSSQNTTGTLTITGKLSGITKFTQTKTTGFATSLGSTNGYTLVDLTNLNGQNYTNIIIDELQLTLGGNFQYLGLDAFTWVKDSGMILLPVTLTNFTASLGSNGVLKANWKTASEKNNSHFILQGSADGKTWKDLGRKNAAANAEAGASYDLETNIGTLSLAGFGLLGFLLLPFTNRRLRMFAFLAVVAVIAVSCAKDKDLSDINLGGEKSLNSNMMYVRLAQVDLDGTTTYSQPLVVKAK